MKRKITVLGLVIACVIGLSGCLSTNQPVEKTNNIVQNKADKDFFDYAFNHSKCYTEDNMKDCIKGMNEYEEYARLTAFEEGMSKQYLRNKIYRTIYSDHACVLKNAEACYITYFEIDQLSNDFHFSDNEIDQIMGQDADFRREIRKRSLFRACELNYAFACETLAEFRYEYEYWRDYGRTASGISLKSISYITDNILHDEMIRYAKKACDLNSNSCERLHKRGIL